MTWTPELQLPTSHNNATRRASRPRRRWEDDIQHFVAQKAPGEADTLEELAKNVDAWSAHEAESAHAGPMAENQPAQESTHPFTIPMTIATTTTWQSSPVQQSPLRMVWTKIAMAQSCVSWTRMVTGQEAQKEPLL